MKTTSEYLLGDYRHSLFPLSTTLFLVERHSDSLEDYIYKKVLDPQVKDVHFLPQQRCYAAKRGHHLRRTVKLDPIAEFFIYDVVYKNRKSFRKDHRPTRRSFGYRFEGGAPESAAQAYGSFREAVRQAGAKYKHKLAVDVATYFNTIYHHDVVACVRAIDWPDKDAEALGIFLREINSGRSIDCVPHGIHPCKALGSEFLRFIDNSYNLRSELILRFLDDMHLFADDEGVLIADLLAIQALLGEKGLSLNDSKTLEGHAIGVDVRGAIDEIKAELLQLRRRKVVVSDDWEEEDEEAEDDDDEMALSEEHIEYLLGLINSPDVDESDAELVLSLLHDRSEEVLPRLIHVLRKFPSLTKTLYSYARLSSDRDGLDDLILGFLKGYSLVTEYQLFWLSKLAEDFLSKSKKYGEILMAAYQHPNATVISRAKVLEIPDRRFGLPELREKRLRGGTSDWEAWAAAGGTREDKPANRNHLLSYFANASPTNWLIADCIRR